MNCLDQCWVAPILILWATRSDPADLRQITGVSRPWGLSLAWKPYFVLVVFETSSAIFYCRHRLLRLLEPLAILGIRLSRLVSVTVCFIQADHYRSVPMPRYTCRPPKS